jgi:hypothetical protein
MLLAQTASRTGAPKPWSRHPGPVVERVFSTPNPCSLADRRDEFIGAEFVAWLSFHGTELDGFNPLYRAARGRCERDPLNWRGENSRLFLRIMEGQKCSLVTFPSRSREVWPEISDKLGDSL